MLNEKKKLDPTPATGVDPYSRATIGTTPSGRNPGPTGASKRDTVYKGIDFRIPQAVKKAAEKGLEMREFNIKNGKRSRPGGTGIGVARARWLRDQKEGHPRGIKRTAAFTQGGPPDKLRDEKGRPTPGYVAYMLWGGGAARTWAGGIVKQMKAADEREKATKKAAKESAMHESYLSEARNRPWTSLKKKILQALPELNGKFDWEVVSRGGGQYVQVRLPDFEPPRHPKGKKYPPIRRNDRDKRLAPRRGLAWIDVVPDSLPKDQAQLGRLALVTYNPKSSGLKDKTYIERDGRSDDQWVDEIVKQVKKQVGVNKKVGKAFALAQVKDGNFDSGKYGYSWDPGKGAFVADPDGPWGSANEGISLIGWLTEARGFLKG